LYPLSVAVFILFFAGCVHFQPPYPVLKALADPSLYLQNVLIGADNSSCVAGLAKIFYQMPHKKVSSKAVISAQRPSLLRFEALDFFKQTSFVLIADGNQLNIFVPSKRTVYAGPATEENIRAIIGIRLHPDNLVSALLGFPPLVLSSSARISWKQDRNYYFFNILDEDTCQHVWVNPLLKRIERYACYENNQLKYAFDFSNFTEIKNAFFPARIVVNCPQYQTIIALDYQSIQLGTSAPEMFTLPHHEHTTRLPIESFIESR